MTHGPLCDGVAEIRYREDGVIHTWSVGADAVHDTDDSMRAHLARWRPNAEYLGVRVTQVRTRTVVLDTQNGTTWRR